MDDNALLFEKRRDGWGFPAQGRATSRLGQKKLPGIFTLFINKLDGVGPFDNKPSTDKLHHFVAKKKEKKK